jgi:hypothetical protein
VVAPAPSGTNLIALSPSPGTAALISRRQLNTILAFTLCRRATSETDDPAAYVSATIRRFSSTGHDRRRCRPSPMVAFPASSDTDISPRVHYPFVDTIIVSHSRYQACPINLTGSRRYSAVLGGYSAEDYSAYGSNHFAPPSRLPTGRPRRRITLTNSINLGPPIGAGIDDSIVTVTSQTYAKL